MWLNQIILDIHIKIIFLWGLLSFVHSLQGRLFFHSTKTTLSNPKFLNNKAKKKKKHLHLYIKSTKTEEDRYVACRGKESIDYEGGQHSHDAELLTSEVELTIGPIHAHGA